MRFIKKLPLVLCLLGFSTFLTAQSSSLKKNKRIKTYHLRMAAFETDYGNTFTDRDVWIKLTSYLRLPERGDLIVQLTMEEGLGLESVINKPTKNGTNYYNVITYLTPTYTAVVKDRYGRTVWEQNYASQKLVYDYKANGQLSEAELTLNWENKGFHELKRLEKESLNFKQLEQDLNALLSDNKLESPLAQTNTITKKVEAIEIVPAATTTKTFVASETATLEIQTNEISINKAPSANYQEEVTEFVAPENTDTDEFTTTSFDEKSDESEATTIEIHADEVSINTAPSANYQEEVTEFVAPENTGTEEIEAFSAPTTIPVEDTSLDNNNTNDNNAGFYTAPDADLEEGSFTSPAYNDVTDNTTPVINNSRLGLVIGGGQMPLNLSRGNIQTFIIDDSPSMDQFSSNVFIESDDDISFLRLGFMGDNSDANRTYGIFFDIGLGTQGVSKFEFEYNYGWQIGKGWFRLSPQLGFVAGNSNIQLGEMFQNDLFIEIGDTQFFSDAVQVSYRNLYVGASGRMNVNLSLGKKFGLSLYGGYTRGFSLSERIKFNGDDEEGLPTKAFRTLPNDRTSFFINNDDSNSERLFDFSGIKMGASFIYYIGN